MFSAADYVCANATHGWSIKLQNKTTETEEDEHHLTLERPSPEYDEGEGLYFELDGQEAGCFGGLLEIAITGKELIVALTAKGQRQTKLGSAFTIALDMPDERRAQLAADLERVCDGMCRVRRRS